MKIFTVLTIPLLYMITYVQCQNDPCPICDEGSTLLDPTKLVDIPEGYINIKQASCDQIDSVAKSGIIEPDICKIFTTSYFKSLCPCSELASTNLSTTAPSEAIESDTSLLPFDIKECFVCGEGFTVGIPNKSISIPPGYVIDSATCYQIEQLGAFGLIDETYCNLLRTIVVEPNCTCVEVSENQNSSDSSIVDDSACFVCGEGKKVGNPNGQVSVPDGYVINSTSCYQVEQIGLIGLIPSRFCGIVRRRIKNSECDCIDDTSIEPSDVTSETPSDATSETPSDVPTNAPLLPTNKPIARPWKKPVRTPTWSAPVRKPTWTWSKPAPVRNPSYSKPSAENAPSTK